MAIVVAALSLVFRIWVAVDAYMVAHGWPQPRVRSRRVHRAIAAATFVVVATFIAVPHFFVVRYAVAQLDLLHDVFSATTTVTATPTPACRYGGAIRNRFACAWFSRSGFRAGFRAGFPSRVLCRFLRRQRSRERLGMETNGSPSRCSAVIADLTASECERTRSL